MPRSSLWGRRFHIAGSIDADPAVASPGETEAALALVSELVPRLIKAGATFVVPLDAEKHHCDGRPVCFDWTVWEAIGASLHLRPSGVGLPLAVAVKHHKSEDQVPESRQPLWDRLRYSDLVAIDNTAHWNMNSKRMEAAARSGDILLAIGGGEGVSFLANLYHEAGKPVVPLNYKLGAADRGAARLFSYGGVRSQTARLFQVQEKPDAHTWLNRIDFPPRRTVVDRADDLLALLAALERPRAFVVRLLDDKHADYPAVDLFFESVVRPVVEDELGFKLTVVDGRTAYDQPRIDQEIFSRLHKSGVVIADITGARPNCFIELGYGLGRCHPTLLTARSGTSNPFDVYTVPAHFWKEDGALDTRRAAFRAYWSSAVDRPPLVASDPLIP